MVLTENIMKAPFRSHFGIDQMGSSLWFHYYVPKTKELSFVCGFLDFI